MASKGGSTRRVSNPTTKSTTQLKKKKNKKILKNINNKNQGRRIISTKIAEEIEASSYSAMAASIESSASSSDFEECCTPKAERFRIPEIQICPPAPKKQRLFSNCSLQKTSPIAFFASPDIELFFFFSQSQ